ncbi:MAG: DUF1003 domain-containing protein [Dehalococcoidia bacterium]|jgi:uncharacterized membrane protein
MARKQQEEVICSICKEKKKLSDTIPSESIREPLADMIHKVYPEWTPSGCICTTDFNQFRAKYIRKMLEADKGELTTLEEQVMKSLREQEILSKNVNVEFDEKLTVGERMADRVADNAGSWRFIIIFISILIAWVIINSIIILVWRPFDPYPFILLNLFLSCIAALQAPIIMMSQNRQEAKDRLRAEHDYMVNLKAELEIRHLHDKLDHLLLNQWQRLLEIQEIQVELMEELACQKSSVKPRDNKA